MYCVCLCSMVSFIIKSISADLRKKFKCYQATLQQIQNQKRKSLKFWNKLKVTYFSHGQINIRKNILYEDRNQVHSPINRGKCIFHCHYYHSHQIDWKACIHFSIISIHWSSLIKYILSDHAFSSHALYWTIHTIWTWIFFSFKKPAITTYMIIEL